MINVVYKMDDDHEIVIASFLFPKDAQEWVENNPLDVYIQENA